MISAAAILPRGSPRLHWRCDEGCGNQKNLQGSIFGGANPYHDIPQLLSLYQIGKLNLDDMVTRCYRLEQINDGYRDMVAGSNIRGVIRYTDADR